MGRPQLTKSKFVDYVVDRSRRISKLGDGCASSTGALKRALMLSLLVRERMELLCGIGF
jgi:hypothetical protein